MLPIIGLLATLTAAAPAMVPVVEPVEAAKYRFRKWVERLDDAVLLLLIGLLFPIVVLVVGTPIALLARVVVEIAERLWLSFVAP